MSPALAPCLSRQTDIPITDGKKKPFIIMRIHNNLPGEHHTWDIHLYRNA
jgi:hypothetical protein